MGIFNPHILKVKQLTTDWDDPTPADFVVYGECEDQPNDAGRTTTNKDGLTIQFKSIVFVDRDLAPLPVGSKLQVFEQDGITKRLEGTVTRFGHGHFKNRIWVS